MKISTIKIWVKDKGGLVLDDMLSPVDFNLGTTFAAKEIILDETVDTEEKVAVLLLRQANAFSFYELKDNVLRVAMFDMILTLKQK